MERVHYRRVSPPRTGSPAGRDTFDRSRYGPAESEASGYREKLILQGIVSGLILVFILLACLIENRLTGYVKSNLRLALDGWTTAENIMTEVQNFSQNLWDTPEKNDSPAEEVPFVSDISAETSQTGTDTATVEEPAQVVNQSAGGTDFYIDEDVLAELNTQAAYEDASKSPVPEPPVSPEP